MVEINKRAQEVLEHRKDALRKIEKRKNKSEEREKEELQEFVNLILNVFDASDEEQKETEDIVLVWKVNIMRIGAESNKRLRSIVSCLVNFCPNENEGEYYSKTSVFSSEIKKVASAMKEVEDKEISERIFNKVYDYFSNVPGYKASQTINGFIITMSKD